MPDYYKILGVSKSASQDEIKKQYKKMALKYHPDRKGGNAAKFKDISEAYQILSNPSRRSNYDNPSPFGNEHVDIPFTNPTDIFDDIFGRFNSNIHPFSRMRNRPPDFFDGNVSFSTTSTTVIFDGENKIEKISHMKLATLKKYMRLYVNESHCFPNLRPR